MYELAKLLWSKKRLPEAKHLTSFGIVRYPSHYELNELNISLANAGATQNVVSELVADIDCFCLFIGYPGSGHSVVGALLDAHPQILISHELDVLQLTDRDLSAEAIFQMIAENSAAFASSGRWWGGIYAVPGQWQGRYSKLKVIGDKKGAGVSYLVKRDPEILQRFSEKVGKPIKIIHVHRNPFDNIVKISKKLTLQMDDSIRKYCKIADSVGVAKKVLPEGAIFDLAHERLIGDPKQALADLCRFLELPAEDSYLTACSGIVYQSPNKRRRLQEWEPEVKREIDQRIKAYPWMAQYSFDD